MKFNAKAQYLYHPSPFLSYFSTQFPPQPQIDFPLPSSKRGMRPIKMRSFNPNLKVCKTTLSRFVESIKCIRFDDSLSMHCLNEKKNDCWRSSMKFFPTFQLNRHCVNVHSDDFRLERMQKTEMKNSNCHSLQGTRYQKKGFIFRHFNSHLLTKLLNIL